MAIPGRIEEGLIQHRYGYSHDLPDYLEEAEIAMTVDNGGVYIGAPMFKAIDGRERGSSNIYPYHNIEILTEVSNNAEIIKVPFNIFNTSLNMPIVLIAYSEPDPTLGITDKIALNGIQLQISASDTTIEQMATSLNELIQIQTSDISVDVFENKFKITFYSRNGKSLILDSLTAEALQRFGFVNKADSNITHKVITPTKISSRSLGEVLSDRISIKTFGTINNADDNCSVLTNSAVDIVYRTSKDYLKKELYFPAGEYNYETEAVYLTSNAKLVGENNVTLSFNNKDMLRMVSNTDSKGLYKQSAMYAKKPGDITDIELQNLTFKSNKQLNGLEFYGVSDLYLKKCNIHSNGSDFLFSLQTTTNQGTYLRNIKNILLEDGDFSGGQFGIDIEGYYLSTSSIKHYGENIIIKDIRFKDITNCCIYLKYCKNVVIEHCDFSDESITGKFIKIENCDNVIIRDCIYPENFTLNLCTDNKILFSNSYVNIEDYIYTVISHEKHTPILFIPNDKNELFAVRLDYDVLSNNFINRSGTVTSYHKSEYNSERIRDNALICDTQLQFTLKNGNNNNLLKIICENNHDVDALVRYKLSFYSLSPEYTAQDTGYEDTDEPSPIPSWVPGATGGTTVAEQIDDLYSKVNTKQNKLVTIQDGDIVISPETNLIETRGVVHTTGNESIAGQKTFTSNMFMTKDAPLVQLKNTEIDTSFTELGENGKFTIGTSYISDNDKELGYSRHRAYTKDDINWSEMQTIAIDPDPTKTHADGTRKDAILSLGTNGEQQYAELNFKPESESNNKQLITSEWLNQNRSQCITKIPQDIKLELDTETHILTLKAGSKIYVPNGFEEDGTTKHFEENIISQDLSRTLDSTTGSKSGNYLIFYYPEENRITSIIINDTSSGDTNPTETASDTHIFYNTSTNLIQYTMNHGETWSRIYGLPLVICSVSSESFQSIEQIFNGFGYIGSTVFALPGVSALLPDGRNEDGTLKNRSVTVQSVLTKAIPSNTGWHYFVINSTGTSCDYATEFCIGTTLPENVKDFTRFYNIETNETYWLLSGVATKAVMFIPNFRIEHEKADPYKITSMETVNTFQAVNYKEYQETADKVELKQDKATAVNYNHITNCLTHIPEDIKFEIDSTDNKLVLKAGSKVYIPNGFTSTGAMKFDEKVLKYDYKYSDTSTSQLIAACSIQYLESTDTWTQWRQQLNSWKSGPTAPSNPSDTMIWYDTTNNIIKRYLSGSWQSGGYALPLGIATFAGANEVCSHIDQVFNGFGFIGDTTFILPGVKALFADGRNPDGSLRNIEIVQRNVIINRQQSYASKIGGLHYEGTGYFYMGTWGSDYIVSDTFPSDITNCLWYNTTENRVYEIRNHAIYASHYWIKCANYVKEANQNISKFNVYRKVFQAADSNDYGGNELINLLYPVGSIYLGTQSVCPLTLLLPGSAWELVSSGKALWTGNGTNANTTIAAGLPNITGTMNNVVISDSGTGADGSLYIDNQRNFAIRNEGQDEYQINVKFDASRSSGIYRNDVTTVQPPAYVVNVWRRTA